MSRRAPVMQLTQRAALVASATAKLKASERLILQRQVWRLTHVFNQPPFEKEGLDGTPTSSPGCPDPEVINLSHRFGVGRFPEISRARLSAELLPAGRSFTGLVRNETWNQDWIQPLEYSW